MVLENGVKSLVITYIFEALALIIIVTRLVCRHTRGEKLQREDIWMGAAIIPLLIRLGAEHIVLEFGTNIFVDAANLTQQQIERKSAASKLVLVCRVSSAAFLWTLKLCILGFYEKLATRREVYHHIIRVCRWAVGLTFIAVVLSTFLECRPFRKYWEITPNPAGQCTDANTELVVMGVSNVVTDIALILIPMPLIYKLRLPNARKFQLVVPFSLGIFVIIITIIRIPILYRAKAQQPDRTMWISIEIGVACLVANSLIIYGLTKRRRGSGTDEERRCSVDHNPKTSNVRRSILDSDTELLRETAAYGGYLPEAEPSPCPPARPDPIYQRF